MEPILFFYFFIFLFGLAVGSFLNCVIYRLEVEKSFLRGRSYCPHCKHILVWQDLIPLLSFLILKGRCRHCRQKISWQYPLVELGTGILFLLIFIKFLTSGFQIPNFLYYLIVFCLLIIIFVFDFKHYIIPNRIIYPAIVIALIFNLFAFGEEIFSKAEHFQFLTSNQFLNFKYSVLSAFFAAIFFLLIILISKGKWMGWGDVNLVFFMGLFLSYPNILVALFLSFFTGAIIGTGLIILGKKQLKSEIPFGPFLITGTFFAFLWGQQIINWYLNFFI